MLSRRMRVTRMGRYRRCRLAGRLVLGGLLVGAVLGAAGPAAGFHGSPRKTLVGSSNDAGLRGGRR
jgi:hypothetical protein